MKHIAFLSFVAALGVNAVLYCGPMCVPYMLIMWRLVPETTGRSLEEGENFWK